MAACSEKLGNAPKPTWPRNTFRTASDVLGGCGFVQVVPVCGHVLSPNARQALQDVLDVVHERADTLLHEAHSARELPFVQLIRQQIDF